METRTVVRYQATPYGPMIETQRSKADLAGAEVVIRSAGHPDRTTSPGQPLVRTR